MIAPFADPLQVEIVDSASTFLDSTGFASLTTLAAAIVGGLIAFLATRYQANASRDADDRRHWGEAVLDLYGELRMASKPLYEVWEIGKGDSIKLSRSFPGVESAYQKAESAYDRLAIILPTEVKELEEYFRKCNRIYELTRDEDKGETVNYERVSLAGNLLEDLAELRPILRKHVGMKA